MCCFFMFCNSFACSVRGFDGLMKDRWIKNAAQGRFVSAASSPAGALCIKLYLCWSLYVCLKVAICGKYRNTYRL